MSQLKSKGRKKPTSHLEGSQEELPLTQGSVRPFSLLEGATHIREGNLLFSFCPFNC